MNLLHSALDKVRDRYAPAKTTSTFRQTGQVTPEEFVLAGDYLVYKFPSWSWSKASSPAKQVAHLPEDKQYLITRGVPCHRRLDDNFAGGGGAADDLVRDGFLGGPEGDEAGEDGGWLRTGGATEKEQEGLRGEVRTMTESGHLGTKASEEEEEEIPDMEDDDDDNEAIIRDKSAGAAGYAQPLNASGPMLTCTDHSEHTHSTSPTRNTIQRHASGCPATRLPLLRCRRKI